MFSSSNSYVAGGTSPHPGGPQYGQQQPSFQGQHHSTNINGFTLQPSGFGPASLQQQHTGYSGQATQQGLQQNPQQQQQYAGYSQQQTPQQHSLQTGQPAPQMPQKTGQTSSQIAASFSNTPSGTAPTPSMPSSAMKIPKIRLSFLTATDQAKFEQLFKSAVGDGQALSGEKVKDLLVRSKLPGTDLMTIWTLSDTTKSGQLLFPEFALAMYLCNLKLVGKDLPQQLPEMIRNEVSSMVDIISFGVPDDRPQAPPRTNAPNFDAPSSAAPNIQQPQPQASNSQLLSQITSQPTGFASQYIPPQPTGFANQQQQFQQQSIATQQLQQTGFQPNSQPTGYQGPRPPMPPMPAGYSSTVLPSQTGMPSAMPLNAQPTGRPGQWGLVNAPATGLPNIETLQQRMMPQKGREGGYTTAGLSGSATVPWAVTKDEKKIYDELFRAWDGLKKGFIGGDAALEVMSQSGLPKSDLEKIWTLSDPGNKGRLDMDEFAVAMHLIYRKLNGYPVPNQLPPELVPPSSKNFSASIDTVRLLLSQDAEVRKNNGSFLQPQKTGVSYLKNHSFRSDFNGITPNRKDATIFRNNDDDFGYKSSARRRVGGAGSGGGGRTPSPAQSTSPVSERSTDEMSSDQLRKKIREKQVLLDAMDFKDENNQEEEDALDRKDRRESEGLYQRIRRLQEEIDNHPKSMLGGNDSGAERRALKRQLQRLTDRMPELASQVRKSERSISDARLELFRLADARAHPTSASTVVGTGPNGLVTEGDRLKARAKAMMQQRSAALRGEKVSVDEDDAEGAAKRLEVAHQEAKAERGKNEIMIKDVEDSVRDFSRSLEDTLSEGAEDSTSEHQRRRWEDGLGVEDEVRDFIFDLQRNSRNARTRKEETKRGRTITPEDHASASESSRDLTPTNKNRIHELQDAKLASTPSAGDSYSSYKSAEERAAFIKQQAEQRMAERLAALGLKPPAKSSETILQRQERETNERQKRLRQAEEEDSKREAERQRRLNNETSNAPTPDITKSGKKPPPPPVRKARTDSTAHREKKAEDERLRAEAEREGEEKAIKEQQKVQQSETREIERRAQDAEDELEKEREASAARLRALEEQVKYGKIKKQEEKRRKQAVEKENKEREAKLAAQRADLEKAKEKERLLQLQLENLDDEDSSDGDNPQEATPTSSQVLSRDVSSQPSERSATAAATTNESESALSHPAASGLASASSNYNADTKNPFFKKMNQESVPAANTAPISSPSTSSESTNPFHRLSQQQETAKSQILQPSSATPTGGPISRRRQEDDEWSVVDSTSSSDDEEGPDKVTGGSAKQLASMLFGTMAPPRPLSAMEEKAVGSPTSPMIPSQQPLSPPEAPSVPGAFEDNIESHPVAAPPHPPPMPSTVAPPPPPMPGSDVPPAPPIPSFSGPPPPPVPNFSDPSATPPPPPPPPGMPAPLPPPPSGLPKPSAVAPNRSGLLGDIAKGKTLKKTQTKDRSAATTAGKVLD